MDQQDYSTFLAWLITLPDPRKRRGRRYTWPFLLTVICLALVSGHKTPWAIAQWIRLNSAQILTLLKPDYPHLPSPSTIYRVLERMDVEQLERRVTAYGETIVGHLRALKEEEPETNLYGVAVDGKELRGAARHGPKVHLVSLVEHDSGIVIGQERVGDRDYEPLALQELIEGRDLSRMVITMDAMYTHANVVQQIMDRGAHYLTVVKGNQRTLREDLELLFAQEPLVGEERWEYARGNKGHGRQEFRRIHCSALLNDYLGWPGVSQVVQRICTRIHSRTGAIVRQESYAITSLSHAQASPKVLEKLWRKHWTIENRVHYVRDETLGEDRGQAAKGNTPQVLAALRNALLTAMRAQGWESIAQGVRYCCSDVARSLALLTALPHTLSMQDTSTFS